MTTASRLAAVRGRITPGSTRKIEAAVALVEAAAGEDAWLDLPAPADGGAVTPLMFEHLLVERARAAHAHIVLPEGTEERILLAAAGVLSRGIARLTLLGD